METKLDELLELYDALVKQEKPGQLALVRLEQAIWEQLKLSQGRGATKTPEVGERRDWFFKRYGGSVSNYEHRATIYNAGPWAHNLFDKVDSGILKLSFAAIAVRRAKQIGRQYLITYDAALPQALDELIQSGIKSVKESRPKVPIETALEIFDQGNTANSKVFYRKVMTLAASFIEVSFKDRYVDEYYKQRLVDDFNDSLELLIQEFRKKINQTKRDTIDDGIKEVGAAKFAWACEVLGLAYEFGAPVDMRLAKKRKQKRALELHPDRNQNNPKAGEELDNVMEAYAVLENYSNKNNRRLPDGKVNKA